MTCAHALGLIDAGPFVSVRRAHLEAARQHARQCDTCRRALETMNALEADLSGLSQPVASPHLAEAIIARVAQADVRRRAREAAALPPERGPWDASAWITVSGCLTATLAIAASIPDGVAMNEIASLGAGGLSVRLLAVPLTASAAVAFAAGVVVYVAGLFVSFDARRSF